jgi:hypothetical protein
MRTVLTATRISDRVGVIWRHCGKLCKRILLAGGKYLSGNVLIAFIKRNTSCKKTKFTHFRCGVLCLIAIYLRVLVLRDLCHGHKVAYFNTANWLALAAIRQITRHQQARLSFYTWFQDHRCRQVWYAINYNGPNAKLGPMRWSAAATSNPYANRFTCRKNKLRPHCSLSYGQCLRWWYLCHELVLSVRRSSGCWRAKA